MNFSFDTERMSLKEVDIFEEVTGRSIDELGDFLVGNTEGKPKAKILIAIAYISGRRQDPTFTLEQAENLDISELDGPGVTSDASMELDEAGKGDATSAGSEALKLPPSMA